MTSRSRLALIGLTAMLWVVPSIGTQGMGTIGARVTHVDGALIDTRPPPRDAARHLLAAADAVAETALGIPPV